MKKTACLSFLLVIFFASADLHASGFAVFSQGAASFGRAGASIAHLDSPSAVFYNPALISKLDGTQVELGTTAVRLVFEQTSDSTGETATTESDLFFPSTLYATHGVSETISVGLGIFSPFGLATQWGNTWEGRYLATDSELSTVCINPVLSVAVTPNLSIAGGVNYLDLDTSLENNINLSGYGLGDGERKFDGDGSDYGFTLGLAWA
ncbi:MAG TPA: outer membrane protein transport protein, partial [Desulfobacteraceae bacterium]|nr:outer membrane protein transport protein [Desulfobacteraceae bacterium]